MLTNAGREFTFGDSDDLLYADLSFSRLTLRDATALNFDQESYTSGNYTLLIDRVHVDRIEEMGTWELDAIHITNSVFSRMSLIGLGHVDDLTISHSTFTEITDKLFTYKSDVRLFNNVFWSNGTDLAMTKGKLEMANNILGTRVLDGVTIATEVGTMVGDPRFWDPSNGNYRLANNSPAINRAFSVLAVSSDHDGGPRVYGDAGDLGAFEAEIGSTAQKLVVTNRNNSGPGSLRQALTDANALPDENTIEFAIGTSCGPQVIRLLSVLPEIREPVRILGYTQPGAQRNTDPHGDNALRCIVLDGGGLGTGLLVSTNQDVSAEIDGLAFGGFNLVAVNLQGGNGHTVTGSQFGPAGRLGTLRPNFVGIQAGNFGYGEGFEVRIGGADVGQRNVVAGNSGDGIVVGRGSQGVRVRNNLVGVGSGCW